MIKREYSVRIACAKEAFLCASCYILTITKKNGFMCILHSYTILLLAPTGPGLQRQDSEFQTLASSSFFAETLAYSVTLLLEK